MIELSDVKDLVSAWNFYCTHACRKDVVYNYEQLKHIADKTDTIVPVYARLDGTIYDVTEMFFKYDDLMKVYIGHPPTRIIQILDIRDMNRWYLNLKYGNINKESK